MGFIWNVQNHRVRINLSEKADLIIQEDMLRFEEKDRSAFINHIFINFYQQAESSVSIFLRAYEEDLTGRLVKLGMNESECIQISDAMAQIEEIRLKNKISGLSKQKYLSKVYRINNENYEVLTGSECEEESYYEGNVSLYLKCLLEEYAALPSYKRETIFYRPFYLACEYACREKRILKIQTLDGSWHHLYPYVIKEDVYSSTQYLTGYIRHLDNPEKKLMCSLRIPRLRTIRLLEQKFHLSKQEIMQLEEAVRDRSVQYLVGKEELILVRFTEEGLKKYRTLSYQRPAIYRQGDHDKEYYFLCTPFQAGIYFFRFGKDAVILAPNEIRESLLNEYRLAEEVYLEELYSRETK